jgi:hypothetical protein
MGDDSQYFKWEEIHDFELVGNTKVNHDENTFRMKTLRLREI